MSAASPLYQGETFLLTRRCAQRQFLLKPERYVTQILTYVLAVAAAAFGIERTVLSRSLSLFPKAQEPATVAYGLVRRRRHA